MNSVYKTIQFITERIIIIMELMVEPLETLETPGFGEWMAGVAGGAAAALAAIGIGFALT